MNTIITREYASPCGTLLFGSYEGRLCMCDWLDGKPRRNIDARLCRALCAVFAPGTSPVLEQAAAQLDEYFAGVRRQFDVPLMFAGTEFQQRVWHALLSIPYGTTVSYGQMAASIGSPKSVRAVAGANGANSISIFAPCHRVIGSDGTLTGYGGGLPAKRFLLALESGQSWRG